MKYKYCPDCGSKMTHSRSSDGWAEFYDCDTGCNLRIEIERGETMHAAPDKENWIRKQPEPRKPRELWLIKDKENIWREYPVHQQGVSHLEQIRVREVIE